MAKFPLKREESKHRAVVDYQCPDCGCTGEMIIDVTGMDKIAIATVPQYLEKAKATHKNGVYKDRCYSCTQKNGQLIALGITWQR